MTQLISSESHILLGTTEYTLLDFWCVHDILGFLRGQQSWATEFLNDPNF